MQSIAVLGSSGHAKVVIDIVEKAGRYRIAGLIDTIRNAGEESFGYKILGNVDVLQTLLSRGELTGCLVAIGDNFSRQSVVADVLARCPGIKFITAIHPQAVVARDVAIGDGTAVMAGSVVGPSCRIGRHCIVNTRSSIDHDSLMHDFASLAPGVTTGANVEIGEFAAIGIGATIKHGVRIGDHAVIGAGSTVLDHIAPLVVAYGLPASVKRSRTPGEKYL